MTAIWPPDPRRAVPVRARPLLHRRSSRAMRPTTTWAAGYNRLGAGGLRCRVLGGTVHPDCSQPL